MVRDLIEMDYEQGEMYRKQGEARAYTRLLIELDDTIREVREAMNEGENDE